jgi:hypothetical protein
MIDAAFAVRDENEDDTIAERIASAVARPIRLLSVIYCGRALTAFAV